MGGVYQVVQLGWSVHLAVRGVMMSKEPRAVTEEELKSRLLDYFRGLANYWAVLESVTDVLARSEGAIFSVLSTLDGSSVGFPAFDIVARPDTTDKEFCILNNKNWIPDGLELGNLHEFWNEVK